MPDRHRRAPRWRFTVRRNWGWSAFLVVFVVGGLFFGYLFFASIRDIVAFAELPFLPVPPGSEAHEGPGGQDAVVRARKLTKRVNILFLGIDRRENDPGPWRTDTMILFSVDPISNTASMLSLPRDLWVRLPVYNVDERINAAYVYGEQFRYPGGGAEYAKKAVQYNLGVPVHRYVTLDFDGFVRIIDALGGVEIDVPRDIVDNAYPTPDFGTTRLYIPAGWQKMDGELALKYARTRHDSSDIDRAHRQQQLVMAVRDKVLRLNFPIARIPEQLRILGESLKTDMTLEEMYAIAQAVRKVPSEDIGSEVIDETMVITWRTPQGWDVLVPQRDRMRLLVNRLFPMPTPQVSLGTLGDRARLAEEAARIEVQNGTQTPGLASRMSTELRSNGYNVVRYGNADRFDHPETLIICYVEKRYTLASLKDYLEVADTHLVRQPTPDADVDIRVILGKNATASR